MDKNQEQPAGDDVANPVNASRIDAADSPFISKKRLRRERARLREMKKSSPTAHHAPHSAHASHASGEAASHAAGQGPHAGKRPFIRRVYEDNYRQLLWIPFIILFLALLQLGIQTAMTGDFMNKGVSIKGGVTMSVPAVEHDVHTLKNLLAAKFPGRDIEVKSISSAGTQTGLIIEADVTDEKEIETFVEETASELQLRKGEYSTEIIGSSLGASFFRQTITALVLAFLFMSLVVMVYFRMLIPSLAVVLAAFGDIVVTMAIVNLFGMKMSTGGIAAFLMLIGYSVDTDILLTSRVLKGKMGVMEGVYSAMKTGFTTTGTTFVAVLAGLFFSQSGVLKQIMIIILIGLCVDLIFTWLQNAGLLRWYLEKKAAKAAKENA